MLGILKAILSFSKCTIHFYTNVFFSECNVETVCELNVDEFLNTFCATFALTSPDTAHPYSPSSISPHATLFGPSVSLMMNWVTVNQTTSLPVKEQSQTDSSSKKLQYNAVGMVTALGIMLLLAIILLAVVSAALAFKSYKMKKATELVVTLDRNK